MTTAEMLIRLIECHVSVQPNIQVIIKAQGRIQIKVQLWKSLSVLVEENHFFFHTPSG